MRLNTLFVYLCLILALGCGSNSYSESALPAELQRTSPTARTQIPEPNPPLPSEGTVVAGFGQRDITPPIGVPLAGFGGGPRRNAPWDFFNKNPYAYFLAPSEGILDPIRSKAFFIQNSLGERLLFVSLDLVAVTADIRESLVPWVEKLGVPEQNFFLSATHTHSGPGTLSHQFAWEILTSDRFKLSVFQWVKERIEASISDALYQTFEGNLYRVSAEMKGFQKNRNDREGHYDPQARLLIFKDLDNHFRGAMLDFAVHGTFYGASNTSFSADVPGALERELETRFQKLNCLSEGSTQLSELCKPENRPTVLFVNGAEGDVSPDHQEDVDITSGVVASTLAPIDRYAKRFGDQIVPALYQTQFVVPYFKIYENQVHLGSPALHFRACEGLQDSLFGLARKMGVDLSIWLPSEVKIRAIELGNQLMLAWPGEPTTSVGERLRGFAQTLTGRTDVWVMGLTNDYLAYFTMPEEFEEPSYEACSSLYGTRGTGAILRSYYQILRPSEK